MTAADLASLATRAVDDAELVDHLPQSMQRNAVQSDPLCMVQVSFEAWSLLAEPIPGA